MNNGQNTSLKNFHSPYWLSMLNKAWGITYPFGTKIELNKDGLIRDAKRKTGLTDLGNDFHDEPLERLIKSVNEEANLNPLGRFITYQRMIGLLETRLKAEYYFRKFPEISEQELYPAWIIVGLQRTGTTKLQRLLATDPDHRWLPSWEVINPVPGINMQKDNRISLAKKYAKALKLLSPGFFAIHPIETDQPEEDILLLDLSFMSTTPEAMMHVPSYSQWLEKTDQSPAYVYMVKLLKFLQWRNPAKRWILKTPHHLEFTKLIVKHFGEVRFIWPHRSLYESVPSFLSMVTYNQMIFSDKVERNNIAKHWVRKTGYMLQQAMDFRENIQNDKLFTDMKYEDLVSEPMQELSRLYALNGGITAEQKVRFQQHEKEHTQRKYGTHTYSLEDFSLTREEIDQYTTQYRRFITKRYGK